MDHKTEVTLSPETEVHRIYKAFPLPLGDNSQIRVVSIRSSTTTDGSDPITCTFRTIDIEKRPWERCINIFEAERMALKDPEEFPRYTALSYTWGSASEQREILVHDKPFLVQDNLWKFLYRARCSGFTNDLWIDALCIDQSDVNERNHQVSIMGMIYKRAQSVIVWIHPLSKTTEQAVEYVLYESADKLKQPVEPQFIQGLQELLEAPYWSRAWILQESVLASRITIWLGQLQVDEDTLLCVLKHAWTENANEESEDYPALKVIDYRKKFGRGRFLGNRDIPNAFEARKYMKPLLSCDEWARLLRRLGHSLQCTDPRDRVYALLSLLSPMSRAQFRIEPYYSKSSRSLFFDIATSFHKRPPTDIPQLIFETLVVLREALMLGEDDTAINDLLQSSKLGEYIREPITAGYMYRIYK
jgi:hypothetical protein